MTSVLSNNKWRCKGCGGIYHADAPTQLKPCPTCKVINYEQIKVQEVCDFCADPNPAWEFDCEDFDIEHELGPNQHLVGAWSACEPCKNMIERDDREGVAQRSVAKEIERDPHVAVIRDELLVQVRAFQAQFFEHRTGDAERNKDVVA